MKKIKYLILVLCLMFIPFFSINAEEVINEETNVEEIKKFNVVAKDNLNDTYKVDGSSVVAGNNVTVENTIKGIDMVFGNNVTYTANSDYSVIAGNVINIKGTTNNDGFIFGNVITFDKEYKASRDLFVFGSSVVLAGEIARDVSIYSATVILEDVKISGNVNIYADNIEIKNTTVDGTLSYNEDANFTKDNTVTINEIKTYQEDVIEESNTNIILTNIIDYASTLLVFMALAIILPGIFNKIENKLSDVSASKFISMLGYGLFFLIIIPIVFILLLTIPISVPLSLLILTIYIIVICSSTILTGYFIGLLVWNKFIKKDINILLVGLLGITIIKLLSIIPYVGVIVTLISLLLSLSIFVKLLTKDA